MKRQLSLHALRDVAVLFPGDVHELAVFLLKARAARDREANAQDPRTIRKSQPTLHGVAGRYAQVTDVSQERIEKLLVEAGLDLGAIVEFDSPEECEYGQSTSTGVPNKKGSGRHEAQA
jgi:hypothetical protein